MVTPCGNQAARIWYSPAGDETDFGCEDDALMSGECSNLSDLAFMMEITHEEEVAVKSQHPSNDTQDVPSHVPSAVANSRRVSAIQKDGQSRREASPTDVMSTFTEMESELRTLQRTRVANQQTEHYMETVGCTPPP
jgi:hypothetical protein